MLRYNNDGSSSPKPLTMFQVKLLQNIYHRQNIKFVLNLNKNSFMVGRSVDGTHYDDIVVDKS